MLTTLLGGLLLGSCGILEPDLVLAEIEDVNVPATAAIGDTVWAWMQFAEVCHHLPRAVLWRRAPTRLDVSVSLERYSSQANCPDIERTTLYNFRIAPHANADSVVVRFHPTTGADLTRVLRWR